MPGQKRGSNRILPKKMAIDQINRKFILNYTADLFFAGILIIYSSLKLWNIWSQGITNTFHNDTVKRVEIDKKTRFDNFLQPSIELHELKKFTKTT